jgi:hypothetical protein
MYVEKALGLLETADAKMHEATLAKRREQRLRAKGRNVDKALHASEIAAL